MKESKHSLINRLLYYAETNPQHTAIASSKIELTYAALAQRVQVQAEAFSDQGITSNSTIGIKCADDVQHLIFCLAAIYVGATSFTIATFEAGETENNQQHFPIDIIAEEDAVDHVFVEGFSPGIKHAEAAKLWFSTSGTSGTAKRVVHCDSGLVLQAHRHISSAQERFACLSSIEHNFAKRHRLYCIAMGATNVFINAEASLVAQCLSLNANVLHVSAYQAHELLGVANINKLHNTRLKIGGSHVPASLRKQLRSHITQQLQAGYGTTETGAIAFTDAHSSSFSESVGKALPGIEIRSVSENREPLAQGTTGELAIRCPGMFHEYFEQTDLSNERLVNDWFYTGDIGYLDKHKNIYLCGRSDDMFVFNSLNIYPQNIESQICQYPYISDAAVLPQASELHGNIPVALVVANPGKKIDLLKLKKFVRDKVGIRCPRQFTIVENIPRNNSGKILRKKSIELCISAQQLREAIIDTLEQSNIKNFLNTESVTAFKKGEGDIPTKSIGVDSLTRMEILAMLETEYAAVIMPREFSQFKSLNDYVNCALKKSMEHNSSIQEPKTTAKAAQRRKKATYSHIISESI